VGRISGVEFKAPHVWVHVAARDAAGKESNDSAEWANPSRLERDGITRETLKVDDNGARVGCAEPQRVRRSHAPEADSSRQRRLGMGHEETPIVRSAGSKGPGVHCRRARTDSGRVF
jgi:uncharacterized protein DUF6152